MSTPDLGPDAFDAYILDMDGTIYLGDRLLPGSDELLAAVRHTGRRVVFFTNNSTRTPAQYAAKLNGLGLPAVADDVVTSATVTASWLRMHEPHAVCFPIGEEALWAALRAEGIATSTDPGEITTVISSFDRTLDYAKLRIAFTALWRRPQVRFYATHPDAYCPLADGRGDPDAAAVTAAIEASTGRSCERVFGKPSPQPVQVVLERLAVAPARAIVVGDRLRTDIAMGVAAGCATALVLTGDSRREEVAELAPAARPTYVLDSIAGLVRPLVD
jgi:HAD superfamily hydrolase (TIGR01450 family)